MQFVQKESHSLHGGFCVQQPNYQDREAANVGFQLTQNFIDLLTNKAYFIKKKQWQ